MSFTSQVAAEIQLPKKIVNVKVVQKKFGKGSQFFCLLFVRKIGRSAAIRQECNEILQSQENTAGQYTKAEIQLGQKLFMSVGIYLRPT